ncbi:MAG: hypothetical protein WCP55_18040 [Lentisphaerota bacterium]
MMEKKVICVICPAGCEGIVKGAGNKINETSTLIQTANDEVQKNYQNQSRLRENIKSLEKMPTSDLMKRY